MSVRVCTCVCEREKEIGSECMSVCEREREKIERDRKISLRSSLGNHISKKSRKKK